MSISPSEEQLERGASQIPEHAPSVAFDIKLGKKYSYVDFDYDAFAQQAEELGLNDEASRSLTITVSRHGDAMGARGGYNPSEKSIKVKARPKASKTLVHELQHVADDTNDNLGSTFRGGVGDSSILLSRLNQPILIGSATASVLGNETGKLIYDCSFATAVFLGGLILWGYVTHPAERHARNAARKGYQEILTFQE